MSSLTSLCIGITKNGSSCKRHALQDSAFCTTHQAQSVATIPPTPEDAPIINAPEAPSNAESASIINQPTTPKENPTMEALTLEAMESAVKNASTQDEALDALHALASSALDAAPIVKPYTDPTTPISVVIPRKESRVKPYVAKRADRDADVAYFDNVLRKRRDIARYVMPEYFACPEYWTPTLKLKPGESLAERLTRDYNAWLKSYARALRDRKVVKIDGVFFFPAKITPGAFIELIRAGKRAYCLQYAKNASLFGDDARATIATLVGIDIDFPTVSAVLETAAAYHRAHGRKDPIQADVDSAMESFKTAFETACKALRLIDTHPSSSDAETAESILDGATA